MGKTGNYREFSERNEIFRTKNEILQISKMPVSNQARRGLMA